MKNACGKTALMLSVAAGSAECVKILAPHEHSIADKYGQTALIIAA